MAVPGATFIAIGIYITKLLSSQINKLLVPLSPKSSGVQ